MNLRSIKSFTCRRVPAVLLLSAMVTVSPGMAYQARAEPVESVISGMEADESVITNDESANELPDDSVESAEPDQGMAETEQSEPESVTDESQPEIPDESSNPHDEKEDPPDESRTDEGHADESTDKTPEKGEPKPDKHADERSSDRGKQPKPSKENKPVPSGSAKETKKESTAESPVPTPAAGRIPEQQTDNNTEKVITIPSVSSDSTVSAQNPGKQWKLVERKTEEFKLVDGAVWTTAETVKAQLNVRIGKGTDHDVAGRIRKGGVFFVLDDKTDDDWVFIETEDSGQHVLRGYVLREFITETNAKARFKKYGDKYRSYVQVSKTEKDNPVFGDVKKTVYRHLVKEHTRVTYEWKMEENELVKTQSAAASADRTEIIRYAQQFLGNPYVWGGESLTDGCDCSGFTMQVYRHFGIELPRCSYEQAEVGIKINAEDALPGDLLFYARNGTIYHVLMYIGEGKAINASSSMTGIIISNVDYDKTCWGVRMIEDNTGEGIYSPDRTNYTQSDLELIWAIVAQEDDKSYEGALAVISSAMNRADRNYGGYGQSVLAQLTADGQYCYSPKVSDPSLYQRRLGGNVADFVKEAVSDCLTKGVRNHDYLNFRSSNRTGRYIRIGDNWYF